MARTLTIRTDETLGQALDQQARRLGVSVSEAARDLLRRALRIPRSRRDDSIPETPVAPTSLNPRHREHAWRGAHAEALQAYAEQWVVLEGEQVVTHGPDPGRLVDEARSLGIASPYLFYVEPSSSPKQVRIGL